MTKRIRSFFGLEEREKPEAPDVPEEETCPGESLCDIFGAAQRMTGDGIENACRECNMLPTKPDKAAAVQAEEGDQKMNALVNRCYRRRAESRIEGVGIDRDKVTAVEWEALVIIDAVTEHCEKESMVRHRMKTEFLAEILPQIVAAGSGVKLEK